MSTQTQDVRVKIQIATVQHWLNSDLPTWSTRARFYARLVNSECVIVLTAVHSCGPVGYCIFNRRMSHLHYIETRKNHRKRCVARKLWARVRREARHLEITATADTPDGVRRLRAWKFREEDGIWTWRGVR